MGQVTSISAQRRPLRRRARLVPMRSDERLAELVRQGEGRAFATLYRRHVGGVLSFCRHMLGSQAEAEEVVERAFVSARLYMAGGGREIAFKPWIYTIASNRCLSILRVRRDQSVAQLSTVGLREEVERRGDLRELLESLHQLPPEQRAALVLTEIRKLSLAEVADVLGIEEAAVKGLVFRARTALAETGDAQGLASLDTLRRQRRLLGLALPVTPPAGLQESVMAASGAGAASAAAAGGAAVGGVAAGGGGAAVGGSLLGGAVAKVAVIAVLAGGAGVGAEAQRDGNSHESAPPAPVATQPGGADGRDRHGMSGLSMLAIGPPASTAPSAGRAGEPAGAPTQQGGAPLGSAPADSGAGVQTVVPPGGTGEVAPGVDPGPTPDPPPSLSDPPGAVPGPPMPRLPTSPNGNGNGNGNDNGKGRVVPELPPVVPPSVPSRPKPVKPRDIVPPSALEPADRQ